MKNIILTVTALLLVAGCKPAASHLSHAEPIPETVLENLHGQTRSAVIEVLGKPSKEFTGKHGDTMWEYTKDSQMIVIDFTKDNPPLVHVVNSGRTEEEAYFPWTQTEIDEESSNKFLRGPGEEPQPEDKTPVAVVVDALVATLSQSSLENYRSCLHPQTVKVPEYGSEEAMRFWKKQFDDLKADGFTGNWRFKEVQASEASPRFPAGSVKAYPIVGERETGEYLLLILVDGEWRVLRLFS